MNHQQYSKTITCVRRFQMYRVLLDAVLCEKLSAGQIRRQTMGLDERQTGRETEWKSVKTVRTCSQTVRQINRRADDQTANWKHAGGLSQCRQRSV